MPTEEKIRYIIQNTACVIRIGNETQLGLDFNSKGALQFLPDQPPSLISEMPSCELYKPVSLLA